MKNQAMKKAFLSAMIVLLMTGCEDEEEFNPLFSGYWDHSVKTTGTPNVTLKLQHRNSEVSGTMTIAQCNCCDPLEKYTVSGTVNSFGVLAWESIIEKGGTTSGTFKQTTDVTKYDLVMLYNCGATSETFNYTMEKGN